MDSRMQSSLLNLPVEVLDMIVTCLSRSFDLLSLARCHSKLYHIVVPDHLHYRDVSLNVDDYIMWIHLLNNPRLASRIEVLSLGDRFNSRWPPIKHEHCEESRVYSVPDEAELDTISNALQSMRLLKQVLWCCSGNEPLGMTPRMRQLQSCIWAAIRRHCPKVENISSRSCRRCFYRNDEESQHPLANLSQIATLSVEISLCSHHKSSQDQTSGISDLSYLSALRGLRRLTIRPSDFRYTGTSQDLLIILGMTFPALESIHMWTTADIPFNSLLVFLTAHPLLHTLEWGRPWHTGRVIVDPVEPTTATAQTTILRLEKLDSSFDLVKALYEYGLHRTGAHRPLKSLRTTLWLGSASWNDYDPKKLVDLFSSTGSKLEVLVLKLKGWSSQSLAEGLPLLCSVFPNLQKLDIDNISMCQTERGRENYKAHDWIVAVGEFKRLVVLTIPTWQSEVAGLLDKSHPSKRRHRTMRHLLKQCPRLRLLFSGGQGLNYGLAVLIGHDVADILYAPTRLIDQGKTGSRAWAAYDGWEVDLEEEISSAMRIKD